MFMGPGFWALSFLAMSKLFHIYIYIRRTHTHLFFVWSVIRQARYRILDNCSWRIVREDAHTGFVVVGGGRGGAGTKAL